VCAQVGNTFSFRIRLIRKNLGSQGQNSTLIGQVNELQSQVSFLFSISYGNYQVCEFRPSVFGIRGALLPHAQGGIRPFLMATPELKHVTGNGTSAPDFPPDVTVFGESAAMSLIRQKVEKVSGADVPVLVLGESGTGKEVISRMVHRRSPRAQGSFIKVNCAAIPGTLLESELFGYEKGSFTGAATAKPGRVEMAHGGTLFLDEIAEMDLGLQAKLLQLLQDGQFCRIGGRENIVVDVRIICATNRNLEVEIAEGRFRQDLFYRINVVAVQLPPLRERSEDIQALVHYFVEQHSRKYSSQVQLPSEYALRLLQKHRWPGNIRELSNLIERYAILGSEDAITNELVGAIPAAPRVEMQRPNGSIPLRTITRHSVQELERKIILRALIAHRWNRKRAAQDLKISYRALLYKIRQAGLPSRRLAAETAANEILEGTRSLPNPE
jgi:two-component system, NtrC family, response regulator AtoC